MGHIKEEKRIAIKNVNCFAEIDQIDLQLIFKTSRVPKNFSRIEKAGVKVLPPECVSISQTSFQLSDMNSFFIQLLALASISVAMPAIDNGMGEHIFGPERVVADFAALSGSNIDKLPDSFTVCSSVTTGGAFTGPISPFQLLHKNGEPWISMIFMTNEKNITNQQIWVLVSSRLNLYFLFLFLSFLFQPTDNFCRGSSVTPFPGGFKHRFQWGH